MVIFHDIPSTMIFQGLCYLIIFENRALRYNYLHFHVSKASGGRSDGMQTSFSPG